MRVYGNELGLFSAGFAEAVVGLIWLFLDREEVGLVSLILERLSEGFPWTGLEGILIKYKLLSENLLISRVTLL
jgi:hypothetical protein